VWRQREVPREDRRRRRLTNTNTRGRGVRKTAVVAVLALVISVLCLALNAFFVAAEFAIVKVRLTQLKPRARRGERRAIAAEAVLSKLDRYLSVTQLGITVASLGLGWIGEPAIERLGDGISIALTGSALGRGGHVAVDIIGLATLTFLHLLVGELVPKAIAIRHSEATALFTAIPLRFVNIVLAPVLWVFEQAQRATLRLLHVDPDMTEGVLSEEEIVGILAANATHRRPVMADRQRTLERVLRLASRPARQIMVPRVDVVALSIECSGEHAYEALKEHGFSRVLLFKSSIDEVVGYLYAKDFLFEAGARARSNLHGLERRTLFVPTTQDGFSVLRKLQRTSIPLAVVVDEYGGTSGIVTIEDLVEEVFGDIHDELDAEPEKIVRVAGLANTWDVDPRATVDELRDAGVPIDELNPSESVGKLVVDLLAHLPRVGDIATVSEGVIAEVIATKRRRIQLLRFHAERLVLT
jgi:CBS domain containing-hemolysin-like protein